MNTLFKLSIAIFLLFLVTVNISCKKCKDPSNPDCKNYDPCLGKTKVTADFVFEIQVNDKWYEVDEVFRYNDVRFKAKNQALSYKWILGTEEINSKSFIRTGFPENSVVPCTLIIEKTPNTKCFPNDKDKDTVVRELKISKNESQVSLYKTLADTVDFVPYKFYGEYLGHKESNPSVEFKVKLYHTWYIRNGAIELSGQIAGLPYSDCVPTTIWPHQGPWTNYVFSVKASGTIGDENLWGMHGDGSFNSKTNEIRIEFTHVNREEYYRSGRYDKEFDIKDVFIGKKIK